MSKKKVVIISHHFPPEATGGASRIYEMSESLKNDYNIKILCPPPTFPFTKYNKARYFIRKENVGGYDVVRCWTFQPSKNSPSLLQRMLYYVVFPIFVSLYLLTHLIGVSLVIITIPPSTLLVITLIARLFRKKILIDVRDLWTDVAVSLSYISKDSLMLKTMRKFEHYCLQKSDLILTNSKIVNDTLSQNLKSANKNKIKYFPFQVNLKSFEFTKGTTRKRQIVYIGNLGAAQNLEALIEAVPSVVQKIPDIKINFFGGGDREIELKELVKSLGVDKYIQFNNPVPREQIPGILSESMIGIVGLSSNESIRYALPTKSFEYFASGLPVVAYGSSEELERVLKESEAGIYVKGDNKIEIADAIIKVMTDKAAFDKYSSNGREFAEKNVFHSILSDVQLLMANKDNYQLDSEVGNKA